MSTSAPPDTVTWHPGVAGSSPPSLSEDPIEAEARATFGVDCLYAAQRVVSANVLDRRHQIVLLPTGSGKSLCFQLPARP